MVDKFKDSRKERGTVIRCRACRDHRSELASGPPLKPPHHPVPQVLLRWQDDTGAPPRHQRARWQEHLERAQHVACLQPRLSGRNRYVNDGSGGRVSAVPQVVLVSRPDGDTLAEC